MPATDLSHDEKLAVIHMADAVIQADNKLELSEMNFLALIARNIEYDLGEINKARAMPYKEAKEIIQNMTMDQKGKVKDLLVQLSAIDDDMDYSELKVIVDLFLV